MFKIAMSEYRYLFTLNELSLTESLTLVTNGRRQHKLVVLYCRTTLRKHSFLLSCISVWNSLPINVRICKKPLVFKKLCKEYFINMYNDG